jgi:hypothetical protein
MKCPMTGNNLSNWVCENRATVQSLIQRLREGKNTRSSVDRMMRDLTNLVCETRLLMAIRKRMMDRDTARPRMKSKMRQTSKH